MCDVCCLRTAFPFIFVSSLQSKRFFFLKKILLFCTLYYFQRGKLQSLPPLCVFVALFRVNACSTPRRRHVSLKALLNINKRFCAHSQIFSRFPNNKAGERGTGLNVLWVLRVTTATFKKSGKSGSLCTKDMYFELKL